MRTETDLREALSGLADTAHDPTDVARRLQLDNTAKPTRLSRRSVVLVLAACAVLILVAVLIPILTLGRVEPADLRKPGYWGFVTRIDPPSGWRLDEHGVELEREYLRLTPVTDPPTEASTTCEVHVYGRGAYSGAPPVGTPVAVGDRTGTWVDGTAIEPGHLIWTYSADAWALAFCISDSPKGDRNDILRLAGAMRFEPSPVRLPVRLRSLPDPYAVKMAIESKIEGTPTGVVIVAAPDRPDISVFTTSSEFPEAGPGLPGVEEVVLNGHLVQVREDQRAAKLRIGDRYVTISSSGSPTGRQSWEPGEKEAILAVAASLRFAGDLTNPDTWFDAERTLPG